MMKSLRSFLLLFPFCIAAASRTPRNYDTHDYFAVQLDSNSSPSEVALSLGAQYEGSLGQLSDHHTFSVPKSESHITEGKLEVFRERQKLRRKRWLSGIDMEASEPVVWSQKQIPQRRLHKRLPPPLLESRQDTPAGEEEKPEVSPEQKAAIERLDTVASTMQIQDPIFKEQWHLLNTEQLGHDLNVTGVWLDGITGKGSISAIVDDGLDMYSDDLKGNYYAAGSYDFNEQTDEPRPRLFDDKHGTRCAGEVAAVRNNVCGVGMAYDSQIAGIRILSKVISDEDEATSLNYGFDTTQIYSCSWGPPDDGRAMERPGVLVRKAMVNGVQKGRHGLGSVFVFAAGNGAASDDNCNFDGYTNSIYSITVGAIDRQGNHPYYSEACSAQLVVTYSSGAGDAIHTTDVGTDKCYNGHGGTSAAGPLVVGVIALALSARPDLSWRDLQYITVDTAIPIHEEDGDWQTTTIGKKFSHQYGYGKVDTWAFVEAAKNFQSVKPQAWYHSPWLSVLHEVPQGDQGLASSFEVTSDLLKEANLERLEHVTVTMNVNHTRRGDLSVELRSPSGVVSHLSVPRRLDENGDGYRDWNFMSVAHWGESGLGTWTVIVKDTKVNEHSGTFTDWRLNLWGESINGAIQKLHPLPDEHEDDHEILPAPVATTSIDPGSQPTGLPTKPSDHPDRPTKPSPEENEDENKEATPSTPSEASSTFASPTPTHTVSDSFLPSFFPKLGVSKRTQIWIYGSIGLILIFCAGLGVYFLVQRRRRLRIDPHDDYEFELVGDDDDDAGHGARPLVNGKMGGKKSAAARRRGGELYDAFAGESDEELFSDAEGSDGPYRDEKIDEKEGKASDEEDQYEEEGHR